MKVGLIDYGVGNHGSVLRALEELRVSPLLLKSPMDIRSADCLILPGVGNFTDCRNRLLQSGWINAIQEEVGTRQKPLLGVCVGMQLLADGSEEGAISGTGTLTEGLGLIPGKVRHLGGLGCDLRLPHVGWNSIHLKQPATPLLRGIPEDTDFYFVHSYALVADHPDCVLATAHYGLEFPAVVCKGNVWGTQFHPEKSSKAGFRLLDNFLRRPAC